MEKKCWRKSKIISYQGENSTNQRLEQKFLIKWKNYNILEYNKVSEDLIKLGINVNK